MRAARQVHAIRHQPELVRHRPDERAARAREERRVIGAEHGVGALNQPDRDEHIDRITLARVVLEHAERRGVEVRAERLDLIAQHRHRGAVVRDALVAAEPRDQERAKEHVAVVQVVVAPVRPHPGVMRGVEDQRLRRADGARRVLGGGVAAPAVLLPVDDQRFRGHQIEDRREDRPLRRRHIVQRGLRGLPRGDALPGPRFDLRRERRVQLAGARRDAGASERGIA